MSDGISSDFKIFSPVMSSILFLARPSKTGKANWILKSIFQTLSWKVLSYIIIRLLDSFCSFFLIRREREQSGAAARACRTLIGTLCRSCDHLERKRHALLPFAASHEGKVTGISPRVYNYGKSRLFVN